MMVLSALMGATVGAAFVALFAGVRISELERINETLISRLVRLGMQALEDR